MGDHEYDNERGYLYSEEEEEAILRQDNEEYTERQLMQMPKWQLKQVLGRAMENVKAGEPVHIMIDNGWLRRAPSPDEQGKRANYKGWLYDKLRASGSAGRQYWQDWINRYNDQETNGAPINYHPAFEAKYKQPQGWHVLDDTNYKQEAPVNPMDINLNVDEMLKEEIRKQQFADELNYKKGLLRDFGIDDYEQGTILAFDKKFKQRGPVETKTYQYVAIKCNGTWYTTGSKENRQLDWAEFVLLLIGSDFPTVAEDVRILNRETNRTVKDHATQARAITSSEVPTKSE